MGVSEKTKNLANGIKEDINRYGVNYKDLSDLLDIAVDAMEREDAVQWGLKVTEYIKECCEYGIAHKIDSIPLYDLEWKTLKCEAPYKFESFLLYMEKNRPADEKFYQPRINPLRQVAQAIQELADDLLDEIFINMPSRIGKTQIVKFAFVWFGSRNPELSNLYTAYSDKITKAFYTGCIELMTDPTYTYKEIFPDNKIVATNGDDETIDLNRRKSYPTFTSRSIYGTLNGSCDCSGLGIADDLFSGIEEAVSTDRQDTVWGKFDNNFMKRLKRKAKLINMGTRWALGDCQGRRRALLENNKEYRNRRHKVISIPALDENDESNFDYPYNLGYSTEDYKMSRASFEENDDMASWYAQCQQEPVERHGALFTSGGMRFYEPNNLPGGEPDRIFMAVDIAYGGGDYVAAPICYQYADEFYIVDAIFDDGDKFVTRPRVRDKILQHKIQAAQFEGTIVNSDYCEWIDGELRDRGYRLNMTMKPASSRQKKEYRIRDRAPEIRQMYFLKDGYRSKEYQKFIQNVFSFKLNGKNKHDDAPDSLGQLCDMRMGSYAVCEAVVRPW